MIEWLLLIVGAFLCLFSLLDVKVRAIPSILLTAMLFAVAFLNPANLWFGVMGLIMAILLYEADFFSGMADIKIMTMLAFMISTMTYFMIFVILIVLFGFVWKLMIKLRNRRAKTCPFVPVFLFVYITLYMIGGLI